MKDLIATLRALFGPDPLPPVETYAEPAWGKRYIFYDGYNETNMVRNRGENWE